MSRFFLRPVTRMGRAMERVAAGDFTVRLDNPGALGEMRDSYAHFNTMTRALAATETLQSDFISNVSHEFKTPINAIEGYAMLMQDAGNDPALQREYADKILLSTRRLSELVNNILLLSKVDNQTMPLEKHPYRLDEQLRRAILLLERKWTQKQIEWDVDMDEATYTGNESLMLHVWVNLLDNAIKFDPVGGEIRLRLHCESTCIRITVSDNGPGIPKDQHLRALLSGGWLAQERGQRPGAGAGTAHCAHVRGRNIGKQRAGQGQLLYRGAAKQISDQ